MTFLDHLGSSWPSAEAQRVRQSSKVHMARSRNRWIACSPWGDNYVRASRTGRRPRQSWGAARCSCGS
eukprot:scaffold74703_cov46-Phaeocystis_antarctica.AAC.1